MKSQSQNNPENSISERLAEVMRQLTSNQLRFVVAMQECTTKREAAEAIGLEADSVYRWPPVVDEAVKLLALDTVNSARAIRRRALVKAVMVKLAGLDSNDEGTRQKVATEIIEWELGRATQAVEANVAVTWADIVEQAAPDGDDDGDPWT